MARAMVTKFLCLLLGTQIIIKVLNDEFDFEYNSQMDPYSVSIRLVRPNHLTISNRLLFEFGTNSKL